MVDAMNERMKNENHRRLMVGGTLAATAPRETCAIIERGMLILSRKGTEIGKVGAVSIDESGTADAILLSLLPSRAEYLIVPSDFISTVRNDAVTLTIGREAIATLEKWSAE